MNTYLKIIVITFAELFLAFSIFNLIGFEITYPFALALVIAFVDILPVSTDANSDSIKSNTLCNSLIGAKNLEYSCFIFVSINDSSCKILKQF